MKKNFILKPSTTPNYVKVGAHVEKGDVYN